MLHSAELIGAGFIGGVFTTMGSALIAVKRTMNHPEFVARMFMKYARRSS